MSDVHTIVRYRNYAEELRIIASEMDNQSARLLLRSCAVDYDRMAISLEVMERSKLAIREAGK